LTAFFLSLHFHSNTNSLLHMVSILQKIADNNNKKSYANKLRKDRFHYFKNNLDKLKTPISILDIGGTVNYWEQMGFTGSDTIKIHLLNRYTQKTNHTNIIALKGDALDLSQFKENNFDIAFSNSVIEHVGNYKNQTQMVSEMRRVAKNLYLQTPNYYFPIEPHFLFPFFQFLPHFTKLFLIRRFNLGWYKKESDKQKATTLANSIDLLSYKEIKKLFPNGLIYRERFMGLTKSFVITEGDWL